MGAFAHSQVYKDPSQPLEARVNDLLSRMTLDEKISIIHANSKFSTPAIPRLGIPTRWMSDGPHGVREDISPDSWDPAGHTNDFSTYMPVNICLASSWDPDLAYAYGSVIGQEALARGKDMMLGPGVCIMRTPLNGRNYEYLGEDPFLAGQMAVGYIRGAQAQGISSCVKHYAGNDQETQRGSIDVEMDERTLREIYLPAFKAAVQQGHVWAVMGAYNRFRGTYCCENDYLLNKVLKGDWGFQGLVVSDWSGSHTTSGSVNGGLDLEMGTDGPYHLDHMADPYRDGILSGKYTMASLDDKVRRNLRMMIATHMLDTKPVGSLNTSAHQETARKVAEEGIVLLKNKGGLLPLSAPNLSSIAVIGEDGFTKFAYGGESAGIKAFYEVTGLEGILKRAGGSVNVTYSPGYHIPTWRPGPRRLGGVRGYNQGPPPVPPAEAKALVDQAVKAAKSADVAIVFAGLNHLRNMDTEGSDRRDMKLPYGQDLLIQRVVEANPRTIVVLISGGAVEMDSWINRVPSVLQAWYPGMEGGNAMAEALFGDINPSGKLPCTFPHKLDDSPAHFTQAYPGTHGVEYYEEGLLVGYRWFDSTHIQPLFPFGFGLSYTTFAYSAPNFSVPRWPGPAQVSFTVTNTGTRSGTDVAQVYIQPGAEKLFRPLKELKGFARVSLKAGESKRLAIELPATAFAYYDPSRHGWVAEAAQYKILIGDSSRDIKFSQDWVAPVEYFVPEGPIASPTPSQIALAGNRSGQ